MLKVDLMAGHWAGYLAACLVVRKVVLKVDLMAGHWAENLAEKLAVRTLPGWLCTGLTGRLTGWSTGGLVCWL